MVKNTDASDIDLSSNLKEIGEWNFHWKRKFSPDPAKQDKHWFFACKMQIINHPPLFFYENVVANPLQKHLIVFLDSKLNFSKKLRRIFFEKTNKTIGLLGKLRAFLPRALLITFCKSFITPHLDYGT